MKPEKLILIWPMGHHTQPSWACFDAEGVITKQLFHADPALLADACEERKVIVLVPAVSVLFLKVTLPKLARKARREAIGYALEDQLTEPCEDLHFVAAKESPNEAVDVAVVAKRDMQAWLDQCAAWNVHPDVFMPANLALPHEPDHWHVQVGDEHVLARVGETAGFSGDASQLNALLAAALAELPAPKQIKMTHSVTPMIELASFNVPVVVQAQSQTADIDLLIREANQSVPLNLLQGVYHLKKPKQKSRAWEAPWIKRGVKAWLMLMVLMPLVSWWMLSHAESSLQAEMKAIYQRHFPGASMMVSPRERLAEKLRQTGQGGSGHHFFVILANIGRAMNAVAGVQLKRLDYNGREFTLQVSTQSSSVFSSWTDALAGEGLQLKQQTAELSGERVNATLIVQ